MSITFRSPNPDPALASSHRLDRFAFPLVLLLYVALTLPACFLGYGSDNDSYQVVGAGKCVWEQHLLITSRLPGYWTFETAVYVLNRLGGSLLINLVSLGMGAGILWKLYRLRRWFPRFAWIYVSAILILIPTFQIAASSCDDYLWSLLPLILSFEALLGKRDLKAGWWGSLVVAIRPTNMIVLAGLYLGTALARRANLAGSSNAGNGNQLRRSVSLLISGAISCVGLLPLCLSYRSFGNSFAFLHEVRSDSALFTWKMYAGRFGFKVLMALGPLTFAVLLSGCLILRRRFAGLGNLSALTFPCVGVNCANIVLFARFPIEISYLLPAMVFLVVLLGCTFFADSRRFALSVIAALIVSNACTITLAKPNARNHASGAKLGLSVEAGPVIQDVRARRLLIGCDSLDCWRKRTEE